MLTLSRDLQIFLARDPVDMRKSFNGLIGLTESVLEQDPLTGHLFVFINRRRDRIKLLYWGIASGISSWSRELTSCPIRPTPMRARESRSVRRSFH